MPFRARLLALAALPLALAACGERDAAAAADAEVRSDVPAAAEDDPAAAGDSALLARADAARIQGRPDAPVWVVEISDFQCPYCAQWHEQSYEQLKREFIDTGRIRFAYIHLPLRSHPNAWPTAEAATCAGLQGKFWEMHSAIFRAQDRWAPEADPTATLEELARSVGVDMARFRQCMTSDATRPLIQADYERAVQAGIQSTPSFIIGSRVLLGAQPIENIRQAIVQAEQQAATQERP